MGPEAAATHRQDADRQVRPGRRRQKLSSAESAPLRDLAEGARYLLDIQTALTWPEPSTSHASAVTAALAADWGAIGSSMWAAIRRFEDDQAADLFRNLTRPQVEAAAEFISIYRLLLNESSTYREWVQELLSALPPREATELSFKAISEAVAAMRMPQDYVRELEATSRILVESTKDTQTLLELIGQTTPQQASDKTTNSEQGNDSDGE